MRRITISTAVLGLILSSSLMFMSGCGRNEPSDIDQSSTDQSEADQTSSDEGGQSIANEDGEDAAAASDEADSLVDDASTRSEKSDSEELISEEPISEESDSDAGEGDPLTVLQADFGPAGTASGDLLWLYGQILDVRGNPLPGAKIEIWQTDSNGIYEHPDDPDYSERDQAFEGFGVAIADGKGWYALRTILPGVYGSGGVSRPRHIHFKIKQADTTLLTSQFYFSEDIAEVEEEAMFQAIGDEGDRLLTQLVQREPNGALEAKGMIVVDTGIGDGPLPLTPSQSEGPFYPVVSLDGVDADLTKP